MKPRKQQLLDRIESAITSMPVRKHIVDDLFEHFVLFGELPEEQHIADAVARKALGTDTGNRSAPQVRSCLFHEAVHGTGIDRQVARAAIAIEVDHGGDVTDPCFAARHGFPDHGTLGMHILGYPECLATPPYAEQARRLFGRYRRIRARINYRDPEWHDPFISAFGAFLATGELPNRELQLDYVLAEVEMQALFRHKRGQDVAELMSALDAAAGATTKGRSSALERVVETFFRKTGGAPCASTTSE